MFKYLPFIPLLYIGIQASVITYDIRPLLPDYSASIAINDQNSVLVWDTAHSYVFHADGTRDTLKIHGEKLANDGTAFGQLGSSGIVAKETNGSVEVIDALSHSVWASIYGVNSENDLAVVLRPDFSRDFAGFYDGDVHMFPIDPNRKQSISFDINDSKISVGTTYGYMSAQPVYWNANGQVNVINIDGMIQGQAENINNLGEIVGEYTQSDGLSHGFAYAGGQARDLGVIGGWSGSRNLDINDNGDILMNAIDPSVSNWRPIVFSGDDVNYLPTLVPGGFAIANGINSNGWVSGYAYDPTAYWGQRAVVWVPHDENSEAVPEPGTAILFLAGLGLIILVRVKLPQSGLKEIK